LLLLVVGCGIKVQRRRRQQQQRGEATVPQRMRRLMGKFPSKSMDYHKNGKGKSMGKKGKSMGKKGNKGMGKNPAPYKAKHNPAPSNGKGEDGPGYGDNCDAGGMLPTSKSGNCECPILNSRDAHFEQIAIANGLTYNDLAAEHALWIFDRDDYDNTSPAFDVDGSLNEQDSGVPGVHFLTPNGGEASCLTTHIQSDDVLFFDIAAAIYLSFPSDTEEDWYSLLRPFGSFAGVDDPSALSNEELTRMAARMTIAYEQFLHLGVYLDGCELAARSEYTVSDIFTLSNTDSFEDGTYGASGGFYGAVGPLPPGEHFLRIVVDVGGINFASDPRLYTGDIQTSTADTVFRLIVS
jgi:hypothetical protein